MNPYARNNPNNAYNQANNIGLVEQSRNPNFNNVHRTGDNRNGYASRQRESNFDHTQDRLFGAPLGGSFFHLPPEMCVLELYLKCKS